jgi:hypothetical protein
MVRLSHIAVPAVLLQHGAVRHTRMGGQLHSSAPLMLFAGIALGCVLPRWGASALRALLWTPESGAAMRTPGMAAIIAAQIWCSGTAMRNAGFESD